MRCTWSDWGFNSNSIFPHFCEMKLLRIQLESLAIPFQKPPHQHMKEIKRTHPDIAWCKMLNTSNIWTSRSPHEIELLSQACLTFPGHRGNACMWDPSYSNLVIEQSGSDSAHTASCGYMRTQFNQFEPEINLMQIQLGPHWRVTTISCSDPSYPECFWCRA